MEEIEIEEKIKEEIEEDESSKYRLIVLNDDINTFDHVIISLIQICEISKEYAVECTLTVHHLGKAVILSGGMDDIYSMRDGLNAVGIDAIAEKINKK